MNQTARRRFPLSERRQQWARWGELAPKFRFGLVVAFDRGARYRLDLPFRRSWIAILISGAFLAAFSIPLVTAGGMIGESDGGLFTAAANAFAFFWLLGWSSGVAILAAVFLALLLGKEWLFVVGDRLFLMLGALGIGFGMEMPASLIRNFRRGNPDEKSGTGWRGDHLEFDCGGEAIQFGSTIDGVKGELILDELRQMFPDQDKPLPTPPPLPEKPLSKVEDDHPVPDVIATEGIRLTSLSSLSLLAANLIPLAAVLFADWRIGDVMLLFWAESAVIGFYNLLKMARISGWLVLFYGVFFTGHYGGFMAGHLLFIYGFFGTEMMNNGDVSVATVINDLVHLAPVLLAFVVSHGVSFFSNFLGRREFESSDIRQQMTEPYSRIIIMHLTIIFGGFIAMVLSSTLPALLLLILLKIAADLRGHLKQHGVKSIGATAT